MFNYTVLLFTFNEELRIEFVLRNFSGYANIVVLDGGSTDRTLEIAARYNVKVIRRPDFNINYNATNVSRWALEQSPTEYVFLGYCSLYVPAEMLKIFSEVAKVGFYKAVKHGYHSITYGRYVDKPILRRSGACHFFSKSALDLERSRIHHEWPLNVPESEILILPPSDYHSLSVFRDYDARWTELKHSGYADTEGLERFNAGERTSIFKMVGRAAFEFCYGYFWGGGFKAGLPGFLYHIWRSQMVFNIQARIWEHQSKMTREESRKLQQEMREKMLEKLE